MDKFGKDILFHQQQGIINSEESLMIHFQYF